MKQPCGSTRRKRTICLIDYVNYITDSTKPIDTAELMIIILVIKILYEVEKLCLTVYLNPLKCFLQ